MIFIKTQKNVVPLFVSVICCSEYFPLLAMRYEYEQDDGDGCEGGGGGSKVDVCEIIIRVAILCDTSPFQAVDEASVASLSR